MAVSRKIIFTVTNDLTYDQRMQKICRSLSNAGYEIELVGREINFSQPLSKEPFKQTRLKCLFNKGKLFYLEYNLRLLFYLLFQKFDALCAIDLDTIVPVCVVGKLKGTKLIYDAHEYFTEVPEVIRRPSVKRIWEWVEKIFVPKFDLTYTVSPALAELFSKKYQKRFDVIMNCPLYLDLPLTAHHSPLTILYQGALNEGRGLEPLIESMRDVSAKLLLAGEGDLSDELRSLAKKLNLENKVEFLGFVKPVELKELTSKATIGINLLENKGLSYYYSLSNKFFDYIHAGVPQVCIAFPEYKKINDEYEVALLVETCNADEIKNAIGRLLNDNDLYKRLQKNCEVCSRDLNWQNEEKKLVALYDELLR
ncbi:MAG: glycosyltransferase family 4 protein [Bacteroidetes bacterium]|nr:glycosyltransferase family 4 protein [Bacteroidota bacterium]